MFGRRLGKPLEKTGDRNLLIRVLIFFTSSINRVGDDNEKISNLIRTPIVPYGNIFSRSPKIRPFSLAIRFGREYKNIGYSNDKLLKKTELTKK